MPPRQVLKHPTLRDIYRYVDADPEMAMGQANKWKEDLTRVDRLLTEHLGCPPPDEIMKMVEELREAQEVIAILISKPSIKAKPKLKRTPHQPTKAK